MATEIASSQIFKSGIRKINYATFFLTLKIEGRYVALLSSVPEPGHFDTNPEKAFHFDADPDSYCFKKKQST
jgi:hypothetical protein